jgi:hypothetical protein
VVSVDEELVLRRPPGSQSVELVLKSVWTIQNALDLESLELVGCISGVLWRCSLASG